MNATVCSMGKVDTGISPTKPFLCPCFKCLQHYCGLLVLRPAACLPGIGSQRGQKEVMVSEASAVRDCTAGSKLSLPLTHFKDRWDTPYSFKKPFHLMMRELSGPSPRVTSGVYIYIYSFFSLILLLRMDISTVLC